MQSQVGPSAEEECNMSEEQCEGLVNIIRTQFTDIPKIISFVDPAKAVDFKIKNADAFERK